jgi:tetratricopeptide (TPR) repeat protein
VSIHTKTAVLAFILIGLAPTLFPKSRTGFLFLTWLSSSEQIRSTIQGAELPRVMPSQAEKNAYDSVIQAPPAKFVDVTTAAHLKFQHHNSATSRKYLIETMTGGVAVFDYDNDGWMDIFFVNGAKLNDPQQDGEVLDKTAPEFWNRLFRNNHDGTFTDVTEKAELQGKGYGMGVAAGDYDNDGFCDLFVTNYEGSILYRNNGDGTFSDVTVAAKIKTQGWTTGAGFFDYNNDGYLDLFVCRYLDWNFERGNLFCGVNQPGGRAYCHPDKFHPIASHLFKNNGDGTFSDVSESSHIGSRLGKALGVAFADYNRDGFLDISVANDSFPQFLFRNNGDGTFSEVGEMAGVGYTEDGKTFAGMGTDFADVDDDGFPDIVTTALPYQYFSFFHNNGNGSFGYATLTSGLGKITRLFSGWGMRVFDYDNDGRKDLFVANGHVMDNIEVTQPHLSYRQKPLLLRNLGNRFVNVSSSSGEVFDQTWASRGAAFGDLDNDGDVDIVISNCDGPAYCLRNEGGNKNHWVGLELHGTHSSRQGIGAKIELTLESGKLQYNTVSTAGSYLSANDPRVVIGLGNEESVRQIVVRWPSGVEQVIATPEPDRYLKVVESTPPRPVRSPLTPGPSSRRGEEVSHPPVVPPYPSGDLRGVSLAPTGGADAKAAVGEGARNSQAVPGKETDAHSAALAKYRLAESLEQQGKIAEAIEALRESIQLSPAFTEAHFVLGVLLARQGNEHYAAAVDEFLAVLRLDPRHIDARINLSSVLEQEGDFVAAASALKEALSIAGDRADLYVMLGQKQGGAEQYQDSIKSFRKALELDPKIPGAHYGLAMTLRSLGDLAAAQAEFEEALKLNPNDALAHYQLGRFLIQQKQPTEAAHHLEEAVRLDPQLADAYAKLGILYRSVGKNDEAEKAYRTAVRLNPKLEKACYGLAQLLQAEGKTEEAQKVFEQVRQLKAGSNALAEASSLNAAGVARMNAGELDEALEKFRAARTLYPTYAAAAYNQALVLARQEKTSEAIQCFKTAIQLQPGFVLAHYGLGLALRLAGDPSADEQLRKAQLMKKLVPQVGNINKSPHAEDPD